MPFFLLRSLAAAGLRDQVRFIVFDSVDSWRDSIDLADAFHPQTLLAYGMNGRVLPVPHGAPEWLRVEQQLGYKKLKFVTRIEAAARIDMLRSGRGSSAAAAHAYQ